jgi:DNA helicase HerA-like ATPase
MLESELHQKKVLESSPRPPPGNNPILGNLPGRHASLGLSHTERDKHLYVCSGTGTGKSKFLENLIRQDIRNWSKMRYTGFPEMGNYFLFSLYVD